MEKQWTFWFCDQKKFLKLLLTHRKHCGFTQTQIEVGCRSKFKLDKTATKLTLVNCAFLWKTASDVASSSDYPADPLRRRSCRTFTAFKFSSMQELEYFWYEVSTALLMKIALLWDMRQCWLLIGYWRCSKPHYCVFGERVNLITIEIGISVQKHIFLSSENV